MAGKFGQAMRVKVTQAHPDRAGRVAPRSALLALRLREPDPSRYSLAPARLPLACVCPHGQLKPEGIRSIMSARAKHRSLFFRHPKRIDISLGLLAALITLVVGLSLPVMRISKLIFWKDDYSIIIGAITLCREGDYVLGAVLLTFSVAFPIVKLLGLGAIWFLPLKQKTREGGVWWLGALGKWSMLDVFVVAITVVLSKSKALGDVTPRSGLYVFGTSVVIALVVAIMIDRIVKDEKEKGRG